MNSAPNNFDLVNIVENLGQAKVLVIGDVILDHFVTGSVSRVSPEAPIPVLAISPEPKKGMLGGAGNVVRNLRGMGTDVHFATVVGSDQAGKDISSLFNDLHLPTKGLIVDVNRRTSVKTRYVAGGQQLLRVDSEMVTPLWSETADKLIDTAKEALASCHVLVLSDYGKGVLTESVVRALIDMANKSGKSVIVDPKGTDYSVYKGATLLTPNRKELHQATNLPVGTDAEIIAAADHLMTQFDLDGILATRSQEGMSLLRKDAEPVHLPTRAREVYDVSGAGDTVVAAMSAVIACDVEQDKAAEIANAAAGVVVGKVGTAAVSADELIAALHHKNISDAEAMVLSLDALVSQVEVWRIAGFKVGFTNGCFDLLHPGHISLLTQAASQCDRLIVGLNSDSSIKSIKGPDRPIQNEASRATVLSSLAAVNRVVLFSEDTPLELIKALKPDVLIKGADYTEDTVVGADIVKENGGTVFLAQLEEGHSTTATIARMEK
ncbi:MAG: D-glycero-beta-D-manno-heptose-7-phosphate kinase [Rhodospirillales bacterium]|nr:D-glycero-beta-D-manno-heptose-7-phosphate kinase [Rhodospirillales bacterium]